MQKVQKFLQASLALVNCLFHGRKTKEKRKQKKQQQKKKNQTTLAAGFNIALYIIHVFAKSAFQWYVLGIFTDYSTMMKLPLVKDTSPSCLDAHLGFEKSEIFPSSGN